MFLGYYVVLFVFFFKQKTAYDMPISDWSSDVCSSDLDFGFLRPSRTHAPWNSSTHLGGNTALACGRIDQIGRRKGATSLMPWQTPGSQRPFAKTQVTRDCRHGRCNRGRARRATAREPITGATSALSLDRKSTRL